MEILNTIKSFVATGGINLLFSAICAIVFVLVGFKLSDKVAKVIHRSKHFQNMDDSARSFVGSFISIGLKVLIVIIAASILGINGTALASVIGTAGVAIGLAMQGLLPVLLLYLWSLRSDIIIHWEYLIFAPCVVMYFLYRLIWHRLQGYTGDCCGALFLLIELAFYLSVVASSNI